jgi:hypothetical protein
MESFLTALLLLAVGAMVLVWIIALVRAAGGLLADRRRER